MKLITDTDECSTGELKELRCQLDIWRRQQGGRARLPEAVWSSAAALARRLGVSQVCRALRLNYNKLNRLTAQAAADRDNGPPKTTFVELALEGLKGSESSHGYRAEISDGTGDRMTLHLGGDVNAVVALAESFWRRKG